ncbi:DEAD/DEAH box helicase [Candidatus Atribacteria bacterium MT.SAG.1]|nr:DEAD/DEAH box helicase [Candidatus Atribacteria bacterium MT.SAG.1]
MNNQRTPAWRAHGKFTRDARFSHSRRSGGFRGGHSRFTASRGRPRSQKIDISSFINKATVSNAPEKIFTPEHSFTDFKLNSILLRSIEQNGYTHPTPIQDKIIPSILRGKDVIGLANTGTGKTAAFLIPLVEKVLGNRHEQILIVAPTRELALQIEKELQDITKHMQVCSIACVGGECIGIQIQKLRRKSNFIIGTPGRLIDLAKRNVLLLNGVRTIVLDEADRMVDMGFINDIRFLIAQVSKERQTLCFSATMLKKIETFINLKNPITISVKTVEIPENIEQDIVRIRDLNKVDVLYNLLRNNEFKKVLVFGRTKRGVENLSRTLAKRGVKVGSIHSNKTQAQRKRALLNFKNNHTQALVATDVAARGLHIEDITHVINYEIPETYNDYIHRIGRTGRGTRRGKALTFVN